MLMYCAFVHTAESVRQIEEYLGSIVYDASATSTQAQLDCYGFVFPHGCISYMGPHSVDCQVTIWIESGCIEAGKEFPKKIDPIQNQSYDILNLLEISHHFHSLSIAALKKNIPAQLACYGIVFPDGCTTYDGPHSLHCYTTIWKMYGCLEKGHRNPANLTSVDMLNMDSLTLWQLVTDVENIVNESCNGNAQAQYDCYGFIFPDGCTFDGPHDVKCLRSVWKEVGCDEKGTLYPQNDTGITNNHLLHMKLDDLLTYTLHILWDALHESKQAQVECYGIDFPTGCTTYVGPHSLQCYQSIWANVGCLDAGYKSPANLSDSENKVLNKLDLRQIRERMKFILRKAFAGNSKAQMQCFGFNFLLGCASYDPPHSLECVRNIWKEVGCSVEGFYYTSNFSEVMVETFDSSNLDEMKVFIRYLINKAANQNEQAQLNCYGLIFPSDCRSYFGPHSVACLKALWAESDCSEKGHSWPDNLNASRKSALDVLNLKEIREHLQNISRNSSLTDSTEQLHCYGIAFSDGCESYHGPHPAKCLVSMWKSAGCVEEGYLYPRNLTESHVEKLNNLNLHGVTSYMSDIQNKSKFGDQSAQKDCYGMEFDDYCDAYHYPLSISCYQQLWIDKVKCTDEGLYYPSPFEREDFEAKWQRKNLREALELMHKYHDNALSHDKQSQIACFGMEFPSSCTTYYKHHSLDCLRDAWQSMGCHLLGTNEPGRLSENELRYMQNMTLKEVLHHIKALYQAASDYETKFVDAQLSCFGTLLTADCPEFNGPLTTKCLSSIWTSAGCSKFGVRAPSKLNEFEVLSDWKNYNLHEAQARALSVYNAASRNEPLANFDCFGVPPKHCRLIWDVLPDLCLRSIWVEVGCSLEGASYPPNIADSDEYAVWIHRNLREALVLIKAMYDEAHAGDEEKQVACFGNALPSNCKSFRGPHSVACFEDVWKDDGCSPEGFYYMANMSDFTYDLENLNLNEVQKKVSILLTHSSQPIDQSTDITWNITAQLMCYGMQLPRDCVSYYSPHSIYCYRNVWLDVGCLREGDGFQQEVISQDLTSLNSPNLRELRTFVEGLRIKADSSNIIAQIDCYGFEYPDGCYYFDGPHYRECVVGIRIFLHLPPDPGFISPAQNQSMSRMNLKELIGYIRANSGQNTDVQFGNATRAVCKDTTPPLSLECLSYIWLINVGCSYGGSWYPQNLGSEELNRTWGALSLRQANRTMYEIRINALENGDGTAQRRCYGFELDDCRSYDPPLSVSCLNEIWRGIGCSEDGLGYPGELSDYVLEDKWAGSNLLEAVQAVQKLRVSAYDLSQDARNQCFGKDAESWILSVTSLALKVAMFATGALILLLILYVLFRVFKSYMYTHSEPSESLDEKTRV